MPSREPSPLELLDAACVFWLEGFEMANLQGGIWVWGGKLDEVQQCYIDSYGNFCGGPFVPDEDEIEDQIAAGEEAGETSSGVKWERM